MCLGRWGGIGRIDVIVFVLMFFRYIVFTLVNSRHYFTLELGNMVLLYKNEVVIMYKVSYLCLVLLFQYDNYHFSFVHLC
jgi:hypothetical protein